MSFANVLKTLQVLLADNAITILLLVLACSLVMWYCKCNETPIEKLTDFEKVAKKYIDIDKSLIDSRRNHYQIFGKELKDIPFQK
jgi:hypothetical protein